jgi:small-conductance mechanosensitive channel
MDAIFTADVWKGLAARGVLFLPQLATSIVILLVFWFLATVLGSLLARVVNRRDFNRDLFSMAVKILKWSLMCVGLVTAMGTLGIDVGALLAGLGLTGFALSIALKDIISNVLAGILLIAYRPFTHGDRISVTGFEGTVRELDLRYTTLEVEDRLILIPNSNLLTNSITVLRSPGLKMPSPRAPT